jgi:hypothetical protein
MGGRDLEDLGSKLAQAKKVIEIPYQQTSWAWWFKSIIPITVGKSRKITI